MLDTHDIIEVLRLTRARQFDAADTLLYYNAARSIGLCESKQPHSTIERAFCVSSEERMRNEKGQFVRGHRASRATEFKKGCENWRKPQPFCDKAWLEQEYVVKQRSTGEIAQQFGVTDAAIIFWLRYHQIPRRTISEARAIKRWGVPGSKNPMYGKRGKDSTNWKGGSTPERQAFYSSIEWRAVVPLVWKRDNATCQRCGHRHYYKDTVHFCIHHIVSFRVKEMRTELSNLVLLCTSCHLWVHSKANVNREFIEVRKGGST